MSDYTLNANERDVFGRKVKRLREAGRIPANIYGKKVKSLAIDVDSKEFDKVFSDAGETSLVDLIVGKTKHAVLIHNTQFDPIYANPIHVDFFEVDLKEKVTANIPVELVGVSPADKSGLGTLVQQLDEIEVEALPTDLPDKFEVDVSKLEEVDQFVSVGDLKVDAKKIEINDDPELIIVKVEALREEEVIAVETPEEGETKEGEEAKTSEEASGETSEEKK